MANAVDAVMGKIEPDQRKNGGSLRPPKGSRSFAILRVAKISGKGKMAAAIQHNLRERDTPNARPEDRGHNIHLAGAKTADELMNLWEERAPDKIRKNAVHALEFVVTASPEKMAAMGQTRSEDYLRDALTWLENKHGAENILSAVIHNDETTPHLQVLVIPIDERGKLNARSLVGGKAQLSAMQTDFAERVGAKYGLERGIERSTARHETIKSFYGRVNATKNFSLNIPERTTGGFLGRGAETEAEYHERLTGVASEAVRGIVGSHAVTVKELTDELDATRLKLADTKEKLKIEYERRHTLELASKVSLYDGDDKQKHVATFQRQYLSKCAHLPEETRDIVDTLLEAMGGEGFWHIEQERLAEVQEREAADRHSHEREELERRDDSHDHDRDDGGER